MKKIFFIMTVIGFTVSSCKKSFIDLAPEDQISAATFYQTEAQFRQAVAAAYEPLRDLMNNDYFTSEMRSDNTGYQPYPSNRGTAYVYRENIADFTDDPTNSYTNAVYFHCYKSISRANIIIERLAGAAIDEGARASIDGQAKFLRAWNYFKLVRLFGAVPLYLKEVKNAGDAFLPRSSVEEVYSQIIEDAKDAVEELNPPASFPQSGEATKGAAVMLLAEVYMTMPQKNYEEAEKLLLTLTTMGYGLEDNYADVFDPSNKNGKESIFEVQYLAGLQGGQQSNFIYQFLPRSKNTSIVTGVVTNNSGAGGWNTPTQNLIDSYEPGDKRLDISIGIVEGTYDASDLFTYSADKSAVNYTPAAGKIGVPYIKKYRHTHSDPNNTNDNFIIYRYADALLLLAEALNEQGKAGVLTHLNQVRDRAFGAGVSPVTTTDKAELREIIAHERRVELAFENHRWHDLVRTGKATAVMNAYRPELNVTAEKLLFPIPQSERELNPELTQNGGYTE